MTEKDEGWSSYEEAMALVRTITDLAERQFVMRAVTAALSCRAAGHAPARPFDLLFFVETMRALFAQRENLQRVLAGEDLRWWTDE